MKCGVTVRAPTTGRQPTLRVGCSLRYGGRPLAPGPESKGCSTGAAGSPPVEVQPDSGRITRLQRNPNTGRGLGESGPGSRELEHLSGGDAQSDEDSQQVEVRDRQETKRARVGEKCPRSTSIPRPERVWAAQRSVPGTKVARNLEASVTNLVSGNGT